MNAGPPAQKSLIYQFLSYLYGDAARKRYFDPPMENPSNTARLVSLQTNRNINQTVSPLRKQGTNPLTLPDYFAPPRKSSRLIGSTSEFVPCLGGGLTRDCLIHTLWNIPILGIFDDTRFTINPYGNRRDRYDRRARPDASSIAAARFPAFQWSSPSDDRRQDNFLVWASSAAKKAMK